MSELCPFCGERKVFVGVHDDEGNYHGPLGCEYEQEPWSGLSYALHHEGWGECILCTDGENQVMGGALYDSAEDALSDVALEALARNLHDVASNQQVSDPLHPKGLRDCAESLATKKQVKSDWIRVEDALPDNHRDVLVRAFWHENWQTMIGWHCSGEMWRVFTSHGEREPGGVTHWMELPDGPEEEKSSRLKLTGAERRYLGKWKVGDGNG